MDANYAPVFPILAELEVLTEKLEQEILRLKSKTVLTSEDLELLRTLNSEVKLLLDKLY